MKKLILPMALMTSLAFNIYLLSSEDTITESDLDEQIVDELKTDETDKVKVAQSAISKAKVERKSDVNHEKNLRAIQKDLMPEKKSQDEIVSDNETYKEKDPYAEEDYQRAYEVEKEKWETELNTYLERDLGLDEEEYNRYISLRDERAKEVDAFLVPKMKQHEEGDEPYLFTIEDNVEIGKINAKYLNKLKSTLGDSYQEFIDFRQRYNKKLIKDGRQFYVEF